jgi:protein-disulfide isomerase
MARSTNLKPFYIAFGALVVVGAGAIWLARRNSAPVPVGPMPVNTSSFSGWVLGSDSAPVEIIEYADFGCGACGIFTVLNAPDIKQRLVNTGRVRWRFRDYPIPSHAASPAAHMAAACAGEQEQFWPMHDVIFGNQSNWGRERRPERRFRDYARQMGLDMDRFDECTESQRYAAQIDAAKQEGVAVGVHSTPSFVIGGLLVAGALAYDSLVVLVERAEAAVRQ